VIIPCIDLMGGRVVQLVRGEKKALEREDPLAMLAEFAGFPEIQVIDLDAAKGEGSNGAIVRDLCARAACRVGGGVRSIERAQELAACGAAKIIIGTAAFSATAIRRDFLAAAVDAVGRERLMIALDSREGRIVVKGWKESTNLTAEQAVRELEPYCGEFLCTFVDREGTMTGTDLDWFARLRASTSRPITAAGGIHTIEEIRTLSRLGINCAIGMAVYTGKLSLDDLRQL
jgi:phosphoribosylformimino-5-aminoimidazole carboxamide ribotide isomerase